MTNYISTENTQYDENTTKALVDKLQEWGWDVEYGSGPSWQFDSDWETDDFYNAWDSAMRTIKEQS